MVFLRRDKFKREVLRSSNSKIICRFVPINATYNSGRTDDMKSLYFLLALTFFSANAQQTEAIIWDDARINGNLELTILKRDFEKAIKGTGTVTKPDPADVCSNDEELDVMFYSYKGITYEMDNGVLNFRRIKFDKKPGMYFTYKGTRFDGTTTVSDLFKVIAMQTTTASEKEFGNDGMYTVITLTAITDEGEWQFHFKNGKLASIHCIFSC